MQGKPASSTSTPLPLVSRACRCADELLARYAAVPMAKALRLDTPRDFDRAVGVLAARLRELAGPPETAALRAVLATLDVDWRATTPAQRQRLVAQAARAAAEHLRRIPEMSRPTLAGAAQEVTEATRESLREQAGLSLVDLSALDARMADFLTRSHVLFVQDEYGRRLESFSTKARAIIAEGMAAGLGRRDLGDDLARAAAQTLVNRSGFYWEVVAGAFVGRGRSYAQVGAYAEAGITHYRIEAVLDERTSNICRFLHGRVFALRDALHSFETAAKLRNPDAIKEINPWPRENGAGLYIIRGGERIDLATITRSGVGRWDDPGEFATKHSDRGHAQGRGV